MILFFRLNTGSTIQARRRIRLSPIQFKMIKSLINKFYFINYEELKSFLSKKLREYYFIIVGY